MVYLARVLVLSLCLVSSARAQLPASFSWGKYAGGPRDQLRQGPCFTFAGVGATEIMYRLLGGATPDFSELQVYSCARAGGPVGDLPTVMHYLQSTGVVPESAFPYPKYVPNLVPQTAIPATPDRADYNEFGTSSYMIYVPNANSTTIQTQARRRIKATYVDVTSTLRSTSNAIKSLLINKGPIAVTLDRAPAPHDGATHAYVLVGWTAGGGWILKDSWPASAGTKTYVFDLVAAQAKSAFIISSVREEILTNGIWPEQPIPVRAVEFATGSQGATIVAPTGGCYGRGTYTVNLALLPGATVVDWQIRSDYSWPSDVAISPAGVVTGNGANVTVVATILRPNGLLENITKTVGTVGMPVRVDTVSNACFGGRREIVLRAVAPGVSGGTTSLTINIPPSTDGRYYTIPIGSDSVYINYNGSGAITYTVTVNSTAPGGCALSFNTMRFVVSYPCGY